jgi:hypothetical protein
MDKNSLIVFVTIFSVTMILVISLTRNTDTKLNLKLGKDQSLTIESKRLSEENASRSLPEPAKIDCLPNEESSHHLNCDNQ